MIGIIILLGIVEAIGTYIFVSKSNGQEVNAIDYFFWNCIFSSCWLLTYMVVQLVFSGDPIGQIQNTDVAPILVFMFLAGITGSVSNLSSLYAMRFGNKGLTSAISNTALAISTIFFVVFWKSTVTAFGVVGIVLMLISVFLMGYTAESRGKANCAWLGLCLCALLFNTACIIFTTVPSQYNMKDAMGLRGPAILSCMALFTCIIKKCGHIKTNKLAIKIALVISIITTVVQIISYPLLDKLAENRIAYVFTPVKLVTTLVFFSVITSIRFKEKPGKVQFIGMILCVAGILLFLI